MVRVRFRGRFRCQLITGSWLPVHDPRGSCSRYTTFLFIVRSSETFNRIISTWLFYTYRESQKFCTLFVRLITLSNIDQFSNFFHCQNREKICTNTITKDRTAPQMCCYTTSWNVNVLKQQFEKKTSVTTRATCPVAIYFVIMMQYLNCSKYSVLQWCKMVLLVMTRVGCIAKQFVQFLKLSAQRNKTVWKQFQSCFATVLKLFPNCFQTVVRTLLNLTCIWCQSLYGPCARSIHAVPLVLCFVTVGWPL